MLAIQKNPAAVDVHDAGAAFNEEIMVVRIDKVGIKWLLDAGSQCR